MKRHVFTLWFTLALTVAAAAQKFQIIQKGFYQGLYDEQGNELIPPVYDQLGWGDGSKEPVNELIGYAYNGQWGIISIKNKKVTDAKFYRVYPYMDGIFKVCVKTSLSNLLYHGLIDENGKVLVSLDYFDIQPIAGGHKVMMYDKGKVLEGWLNGSFRKIIPPVYAELHEISNQVIALREQTGMVRIFGESGQLTSQLFDEASVAEGFIKVTSRGRVGMLDETGRKEIFPIQYKDIVMTDGVPNPIPFPEWRIFNKNLTLRFTFLADSISRKGDLFISHINGRQEVIIDGTEIFDGRSVQIKDARQGYIVAADDYTGKWYLANSSGILLIEEKDSIHYDGLYFLALSQGQWEVYNRFGRKLIDRDFKEVKQNIANLVPTRVGQFWSLMDFKGEHITPHKFEAIGGGTSTYIAAKYLGGWGLLDLFGNWAYSPSADTIYFGHELTFIQAGYQTSLYDRNLQLLLVTPHRLYPMDEFIMIQSADGKKGLISKQGEILLDPVYDNVGKISDMAWGQRTSQHIVSVSMSGKQILTGNDGISELLDENEGFYLIKKDGRYGFIDQNGKLRIANRYGDAKVFHNGLAPIRINQKWGYVNKAEHLVIQPHYEWADMMINELGIIKENGLWGVISADGKTVLVPKYDYIDRVSSGGFVLKLAMGKTGFADAKGQVILTPEYTEITPTVNDLLIVNQNGRLGIMDQQGYTRVPFSYSEIKVIGEYFVMKLR